MAKRIMHAGIYLNIHKMQESIQVLNRLLSICGRCGIRLYAEPWLCGRLGPGVTPSEDLSHPMDALIVLGGDGTLLRAVPLAIQKGIPILSINLGTIGFLTEVEPDAIEDALGRIFEGSYFLDERMLLKVFPPEGEAAYALNDVVLSRGGYGRLITIEALAANTLIGSYQADGLIIATPTGSTGYSLSAGGPVVSPDMQCFVLAPICPHTLSARAMVFPATETLTCRLKTLPDAGEMVLTIDGQQVFPIRNGQQVAICRARERAQFIRLREQNFFSLLHTKLTQWSHEA